jgi:predicted esterase
LTPGVFNPIGEDNSPDLARFKKLVRERLQGKRILNLSGKVDKLVPYAAGEPFLDLFKQVIEGDKALNVRFEDVLFDGVGHAFPKGMLEKAGEWICGVLSEENAHVSSKI